MIEIGEYVRTETGKIGRLTTKEKDNVGFHLTYEGQYNKKVFSTLGNDSEVVKHSKNIIDLIEVGDFVNGELIREPIYNGNTWQGIDEGYELFKRAFGEIKTILTKEQYEANCYKVKEE